MDWGFMVKNAPLYVRAAGLTLRIGGQGILLSMLVGLTCSVVRTGKVPVIHRIAGMYIELARNTPLLIQLFFLYFGLPKIGIRFSAEACAIIGLTFLGGAYMAESFRSGIEAVEKSQTEAGLCLGSRRSVAVRQCHLSAEGNQRIQRGGAGGSDVCGEGSHRHVLQDG